MTPDAPDRNESDLLEKDPGRIRNLFADIADQYNLTNTLLTANIDALWRHRASTLFAREIRQRIHRGSLPDHPLLLDACCGTGNFGNRMYRHLPETRRIISSDFCVPFLRNGVREGTIQDQLVPLAGDACRLSLRNRTMSGVFIGFGYRNIQNRAKALRELRRVLKPEGILMILEFQLPKTPLISDLFLLYFNHVLPYVGNYLSGATTPAYRYLRESVHAFPEPPELIEEFRNQHFSLLYHVKNVLGITHIFMLSPSESM